MEEQISGLVEIKSQVKGLDLNTYNISWRTGESEYFNLDNDPVTQAYKHAWIQFNDWTWNADGKYPMEFQATDSSGNIIGYKAINITVQH